jgi:hypothetical protein
MQSLIDHIQQEDEDLQLTRQQTEKIITPLLNRLDSVRSNITESLCGKLIPFAADIVKSGKPLELNAYNFTTTAGTDNKSVYLWAQTQYQPLITLLQRMEPNKLCDLVSAISKGKGEDEINAEIAQLFKCSPHLISVLSTSRPDAEQLSLVATLGRSNHVTSSLEWNGEDVDGRSILHRIISVYSALDDKGAAKLSDIFEAAKRNQLSPAQVAFSLLCNSIEEIQPSLSDRTQDPSIKVLPRLLREVKGDNQIAYRKLDKFKEVVRKAIADLESTMVRPLMSEKAGYRNALLSDKDGQNPGINEMIEKLMRQEGVNLGDYVELARAFYNVLVEDLIEEWPLAKPFTRQASIRTFCLAIMGGMDISKAGAYLRESPDKKRGKKENTYHIFRNKTSIYKRQLDQNYFFKANNDDSWARLMQVDFKGHLCNISPSPSKGYYSINERALEFSCDILDPNRGTSIGTLALRVKKNGDSYKVVTESVKVGEQQSNSFEKDGKVPAGYDLLAPDIKEFVDGLNAQTIDPELFKRVGDKVEEFKVALSNKIHEIIDRLHPEPQGGLGQALVTANKRFSGIFPWLVDLEEMWKLTDDVEGLLG